MAHTKGPWNFETDVRTGDNGIYAEGTGIFVEAFSDINHSGEGNRAEALANARLIAAAPEMLEALKHCLREHGGFTIRGKTERLALAAIAKAEGLTND